MPDLQLSDLLGGSPSLFPTAAAKSYLTHAELETRGLHELADMLLAMRHNCSALAERRPIPTAPAPFQPCRQVPTSLMLFLPHLIVPEDTAAAHNSVSPAAVVRSLAAPIDADACIPAIHACGCVLVFLRCLHAQRPLTPLSTRCVQTGAQECRGNCYNAGGTGYEHGTLEERPLVRRISLRCAARQLSDCARIARECASRGRG